MGTVAITFFIGCGGPSGSEPIVSSSGLLIGLIAMLVYPLLMIVPYGYILADLCTAFHEDGGFVVWVLNTFGPFWGFQVGYRSWVGGVFNAGLLPAFLLNVFIDSFGLHIQPSVVEFLVKIAIGLIVSVPSFLGTKSVERTCILLLVLVSIPMLVFTVWGFVVATITSTSLKCAMAAATTLTTF
jgi:amino acid transporter